MGQVKITALPCGTEEKYNIRFMVAKIRTILQVLGRCPITLLQNGILIFLGALRLG
jgi:hypothetical protein